ncbi:MAG: DnaJ domain-containing protein [Verrucomicrobiae bacterium]|nr:DnaJ domain-containing protein [Verrucomicrobiae bacterium]
MDPYFVLQVSPESGDTEIRAAYLAKIEQATPESDPQRFQELSTAYESIRTADRRRRHEFGRTIVYDDTPVGVVRRCLAFHPPNRPPDFEFMKQHLRDCLKQMP